MKMHIITKELGEGIVQTSCNLKVMRYEGVKEIYLTWGDSKAGRADEITCNRCRAKHGIGDRYR